MLQFIWDTFSLQLSPIEHQFLYKYHVGLLQQKHSVCNCLLKIISFYTNTMSGYYSSKNIEKKEQPPQDKGRDVCGAHERNREPENVSCLITLMSTIMIVYGDSDTLLPKHPGTQKYRSVYRRLNTCKQWPISIRQKQQDLAEAGYFYLQRGDEVNCYHCDLN